MTYRIAIKDQKFEVEIGEIKEGTAEVTVNGFPYEVVIENYHEINADPAWKPAPAPAYQKVALKTTPQQGPPVAKPAAKTGPPRSAAGDGIIAAQIPGRILSVNVAVGDPVKRDQILAVMEAMKMENNILATRDGIVRELNIQKGSEVSTGDVMIVIG